METSDRVRERDEYWSRRVIEVCRNERRERAHIDADDVLLDALEEVGYKKLAQAYRQESGSFWYE